jgi:hypothetical protein
MLDADSLTILLLGLEGLTASREVTLVIIKRKHVRLDPRAWDRFGHWWIEIGDPQDRHSESYGW